MKVFFVKYNDPIYVKLEKLDIMIRLASQANIAQVRLWVAPRGLCRDLQTQREGVHPKNPHPAWEGADRSCCATCLLLLGRCPALAVAFLAAGLLPSYLLRQVLAELKEYATEVDVDFVRKAVRAIGRCAIKVEVRAGLLGSPWQLGLGWSSPHPGAGTAPRSQSLAGPGDEPQLFRGHIHGV